MSAVQQFRTESEEPAEHRAPASLSVAADTVEVRRNAGLSAVVGAFASAVAIAWFGRAIDSGSLVDWLLVLVTGALGVLWLAAFVDARTPLLVADAQGVRLRLGRAWIGLPWTAVARVEHAPRQGLLRDGRLDVVPHNPARVLAELNGPAARQARIATRLHGGPLALPLGLSTRVTGAGDDLGAALAHLADTGSEVVVLEPSGQEHEDLERRADEHHVAEHWAGEGQDDEQGHVVLVREPVDDRTDDAVVTGADSVAQPSATSGGAAVSELATRARESALRVGPAIGRAWAGVSARLTARGASGDALRDRDDQELLATVPGAEIAVPGDALEADSVDQVQVGDVQVDHVQVEQVHVDVVPSPTPEPLREAVAPARSDVLRVAATPVSTDEASVAEVDADTPDAGPQARGRWARVRPIAREGHTVSPVVFDDLAVEPAADPVVGPELRAARTRIGLSTDQLAERTRIRPHVIEAIEVDDFVPCGGDFYARGHLRTLARVLGVEVQPLLESYEQRYAHAPVDARRVFEAELATGSHGSIRGTRGGPNWSILVAAVMAVILVWSIARLVMDVPAEVRSTPVLNGSGGPAGNSGNAVVPVEVVVEAPSSGAEVVVRDSAGKVVLQGSLAIGERQEVTATPPLRVQSTDGSVTVTVAGKKRGPVGEAGEPAQGTYAGE